MALPSVLILRKARVLRVDRVTPELFTMSVLLAPEDAFVFQAGQWVYLHLLNEAGESVAKGAFSIATAPSEGLAELGFGIKIYGRLTESLGHLKVGDSVGIQGPFGFFTLPNDPSVPTVFIAAGIGVTPFRSLIREALQSGSDAPIALIWVDRTWENLLYHHELETWAKESNGRFFYHPTLTRDAHPDWTGWRGRLEEWMLEALRIDWAATHAYVCGPVPFMDHAKVLLAKRGVAGKPRLHEERFN